MTAMTIAPPVTHRGSNRILANAKLVVANPWTTLTLPAIILGIIFASNWAIWWLIYTNAGAEVMAEASQGMAWSGASFYLFVYMMVVAIQAVNASFPLALGWGSTRRDFTLGAGVVWIGLTLIWATVFTVLSIIEEATNGWGLGGVMFTAIYFGDGPWYSRFLVCVALLLFFFSVGSGLEPGVFSQVQPNPTEENVEAGVEALRAGKHDGVVAFGGGSALAAAYVRWKANGLYIFFVALGLVLLGGAALLTFTNSWAAFWSVIGGLGVTGLVAWSVPVSVFAAVLGWLLLRRATPRS